MSAFAELIEAMGNVSISIDRLRSTPRIGHFQRDDGLNRVDRVLRNLRNQFNSCTPISSLPEYVLIQVFKLVLATEIVQSLEEWMQHGDPLMRQLLVLTHVCQEWRSIALGYPSFWTGFAYRPKDADFFSMIVKRAKSMPLSIILLGYKEDLVYNIRLEEFAPRTSYLTVLIIDYSIVSEISNIISSPLFMSLECLTIIEACERGRYGLPIVQDTRELFLAENVASHIKAVSLRTPYHQSIVPLNDFPNITHVRITWRNILIDELVLFLHHTARVEHLVFEDVASVRFHSGSEPLSTGPVVSMTCLKRLSFFRFDFPSVTTILSYISLPFGALVSFQHPTRIESEAQVEDPLIQLLTQANLSVDDAKNMEIDTVLADEHSFLVEGASRGLSIQDEPSFQWTRVSDVLCLRNIISFSTISSLSLTVSNKYGTASQGFFENFPNLCYLLIHIYAQRESDLEPPNPHAEFLIDNLTSSPTACPNLASICVVRYLRSQDIMHHVDRCMKISKHLTRVLLRLVNARKAADVPLRRIVAQFDTDVDEVDILEVTYRFIEIYKSLGRVLRALLTNRVEEFKYAGPAEFLSIEKLRNWDPDTKYWDI